MSYSEKSGVNRAEVTLVIYGINPAVRRRNADWDVVEIEREGEAPHPLGVSCELPDV